MTEQATASGTARPIERPASAPPRAVQAPARTGPEPQVIEIRFKGKRRDYFSAHATPPIQAREYLVVEADRGQDLGLVTAVGALAKRKCEVCSDCNHSSVPTKRILRRAAPVDVERALQLRA
ncbi:MAG: hypothetical protein V3T08_07450, partial [Gemmatimonadota bacterium]